MGQNPETRNENTEIDKVGATSDNLTSQAGLTFLAKTSQLDKIAQIEI